MRKSPDAFRTISEVADWLGVQAHVLRFWESKFTQVKPIKRAGGRRYYRPADMLLLGGIKKLLHDDGLTIKGVQKILREEGMSHVASLSAPLDDVTASEIAQADTAQSSLTIDHAPAAAPENVVLPFEQAAPEAPQADLSGGGNDLPPPEDPMPAPPPPEDPAPAPEPDIPAPEPEVPQPEPDTVPMPEPEAPPPDLPPAPEPPFFAKSDAPPIDEPAPVAAQTAAPPEPFFDATEAEAEPEAPPATRPRDIGMPEITPEDAIVAAPSLLSASFRPRKLDPIVAAQMRPLLQQLSTLRDSMQARRGRGAPRH